jgi:hypothetical protein
MKFDVRMPQLAELRARLDELFNQIDALHAKIDALAGLTSTTASDVAIEGQTLSVLAETATESTQQELPQAGYLKPGKRRRRVVEVISSKSEVTKVDAGKSNGEATEAVETAEATDDDEADALRARCEFEAKRVQRILGVGGVRSALRKVTGASVLRVDDVPAWQLAEVFVELQAM